MSVTLNPTTTSQGLLGAPCSSLLRKGRRRRGSRDIGTTRPLSFAHSSCLLLFFLSFQLHRSVIILHTKMQAWVGGRLLTANITTSRNHSTHLIPALSVKPPVNTLHTYSTFSSSYSRKTDCTPLSQILPASGASRHTRFLYLTLLLVGLFSYYYGASIRLGKRAKHIWPSGPAHQQ